MMPQNTRALSAVFGCNTLQMWPVCSNGKCVSIPQLLCILGVVFNAHRVFFIFLQPAITSYGHFMFSGSHQGHRQGYLSLCAAVPYFCCKRPVLATSVYFEVVLGCLDLAV